VTPADWQDFAEMTGGVSGALTGLLFVAVSLNAGRIAGHQGLRASALLPVTVIAQVSGVLNAWYFLLPPPRPASGHANSAHASAAHAEDGHAENA
jgi:hypothetical protein